MATDSEKDVIRRIMTDQELICEFMEPKPVGSWMRGIQPKWWYFSTYDLPVGWHVKDLTLDALWEVEDLLTCAQNQKYLHELRGLSTWGKVHATAAQRIKAIAEVLRNGETSDGE